MSTGGGGEGVDDKDEPVWGVGVCVCVNMRNVNLGSECQAVSE
jgi:hypothetical protein